MSLNFSVSLSNDAQPSYALSPEMIRACMKNTEYSMFELNRIRSTLLAKSINPTAETNDDNNSIDPTEIINGISEDDDDDNYINTADYDSMSSAIIFNEKIQESIQCFAHCIYEQMGLVKNGIFVEQEVFRRIYALTEENKVEECTNLDSTNKCEVAYKLHLCYSKLKTMEAERRIREIIEYSERNDNDEEANLDMSVEPDKQDTDDENDDGIKEINADSRLNEIEGN